jgi:hypothetical protein
MQIELFTFYQNKLFEDFGLFIYVKDNYLTLFNKHKSYVNQ